ncbi:UNVERIFIED_CONTAM: hypothetical protein BEN50_21015 [Euhalothece sp. KZN 001]
MARLQVTKEQVFGLIDQLSPEEQKEILQYLLEKSGDAEWEHLSTEEFFRGYSEADAIYDEEL